MVPSQPASYRLSHAAVICMQTNNNGNNYNVCAVAKYDFIFTYTFGVHITNPSHLRSKRSKHISALEMRVEQSGCGNEDEDCAKDPKLCSVYAYENENERTTLSINFH